MRIFFDRLYQCVQFAFVVELSLACTGCIATMQGNGEQREETRQIQGPITHLKVSKSVIVVLSQSEETSIQVVGDSNLIPYLKTEMRNAKLVIEPTRSMNKVPKVIVVTNHLQEIDLSKSSQVNIENNYFTQGDISIKVSDSSELQGSCHVKVLTIDASKASSVTLSGQADSVEVAATGSSKVNLENLQNQGQARVKLDTASRANIVGGMLYTAKVKKASVLNYYGDCSQADIEKSNAGKVHCAISTMQQER